MGTGAHFDGMLRICAVFVLLILPVSAIAGLAGTVRVIDADTWIVGGETVRLFGIDAPEMAQPCKDSKGKDWACGVWAADQVRQRYGGRRVVCERLGQDKYGRTIARCFADSRDVAREIVADGLAFAFRRYSTDYVLDEKAAARNARGLHAGQVEPPARFRARKSSAKQVAQSGDCVIKGNISSKGARIYHVPGQQYYARTRISMARGERWFCTQAQARAAGWRAASR
jgi:endonuclease YncB( thermonuclease family)